MDTTKILTAIVSSAITAMIILVGGKALNLFETRADTVISASVARQIVTDPDLSPVFLSLLKESGSFIGETGEKGDEGKQGVRGEPSPEWMPSRSYYELQTKANAPQSKELQIGESKFCGLTSVRTHHANQTCGCLLQDTVSRWIMKLTTDRDVNGACFCAATCLN